MNKACILFIFSFGFLMFVFFFWYKGAVKAYYWVYLYKKGCNAVSGENT